MPKKKSKWSKEELTKLKNSLPGNWREMLAEKHELSTGSIENIVYGYTVNDDVILSAIDLAKSYKAEIERSKAIIASL